MVDHHVRAWNETNVDERTHARTHAIPTVNNALRGRVARQVERSIVDVTVRQPDAMRRQTNATNTSVLRLIPSEILILPFLLDAYIGREDLGLLFLQEESRRAIERPLPCDYARLLPVRTTV